MADRFSLTRTFHAAYDARRLFDAVRRLEAVFLPGVGMLGASFTHAGEELLGRTEELERYATAGSTVGIPLLHPWANRLAGFGHAATGRLVELDPRSPLLHLDGNGLPIHGVLAASPYWRVVDERVDAAGAALAAELYFGSRPELLEVFPFPHVLRIEARLDDDGLTIATALAATGDLAVPVSFGYHPYLRLPGAPRNEQRVELPVSRRLILDERMIPTGDEEPFAFPPGPIGDAEFDDAFAGLSEPATFVLAGGGRRIGVTFLEGYPYSQVYAPRGKDFICFEPMTAPTNALRSGRGLRLVPPGETFAAAFRIQVRPAGRPGGSLAGAG